MTELYTMQRYLQFGRLQSMGLQNFDAWASTFGETTTALELAPEGTGFRNQVKAAEEELQRPFAHADELKENTERLAKLNAELTIQEHPQQPIQETPPSVENEPSISSPIIPEIGEAVNFFARG